MIKQKLKICAVLLLGLGLQATQAQTALFVKQKVGNNTPFNLSSLKSLTFAGSNVTVIQKDASTSSFVRTNVQYMNFAENNPTELTPINGEQNSKLTLFPNPVQDVLNIEMSNVGLKPMQIEIVGIDGKVALLTVLHNRNSSISVSSLPKGLYLLRSNIGTSKFIK
ncbi:MAG: T9SS type A sorting domain-containing protein [Paludibacter sp.]